MSDESPTTEFKPDPHEVYENERLSALVKVCIDTKWTFRQLELATWRPTVRAVGEITGVVGNVTVLATDNNRGLFLRESGEPFIGHIQHFTGKVVGLCKKPSKWFRDSDDSKPTRAKPRVYKKKDRKKKLDRYALLDEFLAS